MEDEDPPKLPTKQVSSRSSSSKTTDLEGLAGLVCLALSDYALWADPDLRRKIDLGGESPEHHEGDVNTETMNIDDDGLGCMSFPVYFVISPLTDIQCRHTPCISLSALTCLFAGVRLTIVR